MLLTTTAVSLIAVGLTCIAIGYWLFCESPALRRHSARGKNIFWGNMVPGALLALFGAGLVTAQTKTILAHRPDIHRQTLPAQDTSWPTSAPHKVRNSAV